MDDGLRVGLIARADDRGLGHMTWEFARHLAPTSTMVVDISAHGSPFPMHLDRYHDPLVMQWVTDGRFVNEDAVRAWISSVDVVYTAETPYDWRLFDWCREAGVASVLHVMPELLDVDAVLAHPPTDLWLPTVWREIEICNALAAAGGWVPWIRGVPVPVATNRLAEIDDGERADDRLRVLHVAATAMADRNGTQTMIRALEFIRRDVVVTIHSQNANVVVPVDRVPANVEVHVVTTSPAASGNYWEIYGGHDLLVMPRRYGGLSLTVQEAMAAGMAVAMPFASPNQQAYGAFPMACSPGREIVTKGGPITPVDVRPEKIADVIDLFAAPPASTLANARQTASEWVSRHAWAVCAPMYRERLSGAVRASQGA